MSLAGGVFIAGLIFVIGGFVISSVAKSKRIRAPGDRVCLEGIGGGAFALGIVLLLIAGGIQMGLGQWLAKIF